MKESNKLPLALLAVLLAFGFGLVTAFSVASTPIKPISEAVSFKGGVICACVNSNGVCNEQTPGAQCQHNILTNAGKEAVEDYLTAGSLTAFNYLALGNGSAPAVGDTTLNGETAVSGLTRATATVYDNGVGNWSLVKTWTAGGSASSINSTAIFNQSSAGAMLAGGTFTSVNLETNDQLTINYTLWVS